MFFFCHWNPSHFLRKKSNLKNTTQKKKKKNVGNANLHFYSGHRSIFRASELVACFSFNTTTHREERAKKGVSQVIMHGLYDGGFCCCCCCHVDF